MGLITLLILILETLSSFGCQITTLKDSKTNLTITTDCSLSFSNLYPNCPNWHEREFDFIIVGAGTAGCTLANRLTENPNWNVLLIEAGGIPSNLSEIPGLYLALQKTSEDWAFKAESPNRFLGYKNAQASWAKGRALGGSSTINAMASVPGVPADYDYWAALGNDGWNWANVTAYFDRVWKQIKITRYRSATPMRDTLESAVRELKIDSTGATMFGYRDIPIQADNGQRYSHAKGYLQPAKDRPNLCVATGLFVTKLWFGCNGLVKGVRLHHGTKRKVRAKKEVIVSAGAINTPKLLMLSGIGPRNHLKSLGIKPRVNLPVGRNFMDHMFIPILYQNRTIAANRAEAMKQRLADYCQERTDLNNIDFTNYQGYINTEKQPQLERPNVELIHYGFDPQDPFLNLTLDRFGFLDFYRDQLVSLNADKYLQMVLIEVLHPKSRGSINLRDTDPCRPPKITAGYLSDPGDEDLHTAFEGLEFVQQLFGTSSLDDFDLVDLHIPHCPKFSANSKEYWRCYFYTFPATIYHPSGSCTMGNDSTRSVVNARLQVWNVPRLRVVDTSVMPDLISGHTNIPCGMVAEKAADLIKEDYR